MTVMPAIAPVEMPWLVEEDASTVAFGVDGSPLLVAVGEVPRAVEDPARRPLAAESAPAVIVVPEPPLVTLSTTWPAEVTKALPTLIAGSVPELDVLPESWESPPPLVGEELVPEEELSEEPVEEGF